MRNNYFLLFNLIILFSFFTSCDSRSDEYEVVVTNSEFDFHAIEVYEGSIYATGGDVWNKGNLVISSDDTNWQVDSFTNKSIFDLHTDGDDLFAVGNDGYIFRTAPDLTLNRTQHWGMIRGFTHAPNGFIAVGGKDFNKGWIYKVNDEISIDTTYNYDHELTDVKCGPDGRCIAVGYGIILISEDSGYTWTRDKETGDFYNSIGYNTDGTAFVVGYSGTIIHSKMGSLIWNKIKNGHSSLAKNKPFRKVKFSGNQGFIVGDNGLIWQSDDMGFSWVDISINTELDLFDFVIHNEKLISVSETGRIIIVPIN